MGEGGDFDDHEMEERRPERREDPYHDDRDDDRDDDTDDGNTVVTIKRPSGEVPRVGKDIGDMRRSITLERKRFFRRYQDVDINIKDGPSIV